MNAAQMPATHQNGDLASDWRIPASDEHGPQEVGSALHERIKELNCLYGMAQLAERYADSMPNFLRGVAELIPPSWQYPEITCARIRFQDAVYTSRNFRTTRWRQAAHVRVYRETAGEVEVFYLARKPDLYEGPFLREERVLLDAVAARIGTAAMRLSAERELHETNRQLTVEREALHETNAALRTVLARIEEEKREIRSDVQANVEKVLMPILYALSLAVPRDRRKYVDLLRDGLSEITAPFINRLSQRYAALTPTEIQICNMIRNGLRTKDIARLRGVSTATVSRHREHIRRKLGLVNAPTNLTTFLQTTMEEASRGFSHHPATPLKDPVGAPASGT